MADTKIDNTPKILGNVDGQIGFRCINGGNSWSIVKNAAYEYSRDILNITNAIQRSNDMM